MRGEPRSAFASWFRSTRKMLGAELSQGGWLNFGQFHWGDVRIPGALRAGAGMITPLALGLATGHLEYGVFASLGSLPAGMVSFQGVSRTRVSAIALAAVGMAVATFTGGAAAHAYGWLLLPLVVAFSYLAGLLVALGQRFSVVGLQWAIQLVIASAIPLPAGGAALRAGLVLAGGLWQGALVIASWAVLRGSRERSSLASAYRSLAGYAEEHCRRDSGGPPGPPPAELGQDVLLDPNPLLRAADRYRLLLLLEEAERLRVRLVALASYGARCSLLEPAAQVLGGLAGGLEARGGYHERAVALDQTLRSVELPPGVPWRWAGASLLGELRAAIRLMGHLDRRDMEPAAGPLTGERRAGGNWRAALSADLFSLRASAGTSTEAGRHALRLAIVAAIGVVIAQASGLPHGYWIVLTILIVLRPDYNSTIYRGVQRAGGTVIGAGLGVATALLLHVGPAALVAAIGVTMTIAYATFAVNYLLFAVFLTDFVVMLMALLGETAEQTAADRLIGTGVGAALALIGYLAWPSWESESAQQKIARLFETQARYASLVLRAYVRPGRANAAEIRSAQLEARRARLDAEASADRLADEPARPPLTARLAYALTGTGRRMAIASLTLHAAVEKPLPGLAREAPPGQEADAIGKTGAGQRAGTGQSAGSAPPGGTVPDGESPVQPAVGKFADGVEAAARAVAGSLRSLRPPAGLPALRELQTTIYSDLNGAGDHVSPLAGPATVLLSSTDEITDAFDSAGDILRRRLDGPGSRQSPGSPEGPESQDGQALGAGNSSRVAEP